MEKSVKSLQNEVHLKLELNIYINVYFKIRLCKIMYILL